MKAVASGADDGIEVRTNGTGFALVDATADVTGTADDGIDADTASGFIQIVASGNVRGGDNGIAATGSAAANISIVVSGSATGDGNDGVLATSQGGSVGIAATGVVVGNNDGIDASTIGAGVIGISVANDVTGTNGDGIEASAVDGGIAIVQHGGVITSGSGDGIDAISTGTGGATVVMNAGSIGTSVSRVGDRGIEVDSSGTSGDLVVGARAIWATSDGVRAQITGVSSGDIIVAASGDGTVGAGGGINALGHGIHATITQLASSGDIVVSVSDDIVAGAAGRAVLAVNEGAGNTLVVSASGTADTRLLLDGGITAEAQTGSATIVVGSFTDVIGHSPGQFSITAGGDATVIVGNNSTVTGSSGIVADQTSPAGAGDVTVVVGTDSTVTGLGNDLTDPYNGNGIFAGNQGTGETTVITGSGSVVTGAANGIFAANTNALGGDITIVAGGTVTGNGTVPFTLPPYTTQLDARLLPTSGFGIGAVQEGTGTVLIVAGDDVSGANVGIGALVTGTGPGAGNTGVVVAGAGDVSSANGVGVAVLIDNAANASNIAVVGTGTVTGDQGGVYAETTGAGSVLIAATGNVLSANGIGIEVIGAGGDVLVVPAGTATGTAGISAETLANGNVLVATAATVTGTTDEGIVTSAVDGDTLVAAGGRVFGVTAGISSTATGTGDVAIVANQRVEASAGPGIFGQVADGDLLIVTDADGGGDGNVRGDTDGIFGRATGTGAITVVATDRVTGVTQNGIQTEAVTGGTLIVTGENVRGEADGILARALGAGDITVVAADRVTGVTGVGIEADTVGGNVLIATNGVTTGGVGGIAGGTAGTGTVLINASGDATGGLFGIGSEAVEGATTINVANGADVTGGLIGIGAQVTGAGAGGTVAINVGLGSEIIGAGLAGIFVQQTNVAATVINNAGEVLSGGAAVGVLTDGAATLNNAQTGFIAGFPDNTVLTNLAVAAGGLGTMTINNEGSIRGRVQLTDQADTFNNTGFAIWEVSGTSTFGGGGDVINNTSAGWGIILRNAVVDMGDGMDVVNTSGRIQVADVAVGVPGEGTFANLETFNNNGGILDMRANTVFVGAEGTPDNRLTISGNYNATDSAQLGIDAELAGPGSTADILVIGGNVTGTTSVIVNDVDGGPGAFNPDGILVVTVAGTTSDDFALDPASDWYDADRDVLDKGFFFYDLVQDGNAYKLVGLPDAEAFEIATLGSAALNIFHETALGWVDRQSDLRSWYLRNQYRMSFAAGAGADLPIRTAPVMAAAPVALPAAGPGIWAKATGSWTERDASGTTAPFGTTFTFDTSHKQEVFSIQGGFDFGRENVFGPGDVWVFGLMGGFITSDLDFTRSPTGANYEGGTIGLSSTYLSGGFFWDTLWKMDFLDVSVRFPSFAASGNTDVVTYGSLTNVGYRFDVGSFFVEPSATFSWAKADMDNLTIGGVNMSFSDLESVRGGVGLRLGAGLFETAAMRVEGSVLGRVWHEFAGDAKANFLNVGADLALTDSLEGTFGEVKAGLDFLSKGAGWGGFVNAGVKFNDDFTTTTVKGGIRYQW